MTVYLYNEGEKTAASEPLNDNFDYLKSLPKSEQGAILQRMKMLQDGALGNFKSAGPNIIELKFKGGLKGDLRIFCSKIGDDYVLLNASTSKDGAAQQNAIEAAGRYLSDLKQRMAAKGVSEPSDLFREINPEKIAEGLGRKVTKTASFTPEAEGGTATAGGPKLRALGIAAALLGVLDGVFAFQNSKKTMKTFHQDHPEIELTDKAIGEYEVIFTAAKTELGMTAGVGQPMSYSQFLSWAAQNHIPTNLWQELNPTATKLGPDGNLVPPIASATPPAAAPSTITLADANAEHDFAAGPNIARKPGVSSKESTRIS